MKNKLNYLTLLGAALGFALLSAPVHGAVIVESSTIGDNSGWAPSSIAESSFGTFSLSGSDKLVVTLAGRDGSAFAGVTYNTQAMTHAVTLQGGSPGYQTSIWYLDNPGTTTGNLAFTAGPSRGVIASLWALSGTEAGVGATGSASTSSATLTTTSANSWVLASTGSSLSGTSVSTVSAPIPAVGSPMTEGENLVQDYANKGNEPNTLGTGYQTVATAGSLATSAFDSGYVTTAAEFTAIPEPSTALLGALGLLALLRRRR